MCNCFSNVWLERAEAAAQVSLGCSHFVRVSEQRGQGSRVSRRLHHLPFFLVLGKACEVAGPPPRRWAHGAGASWLGSQPGAGLLPALPMCAVLSQDTAAWHGASAGRSALFREEPLGWGWSSSLALCLPVRCVLRNITASAVPVWPELLNLEVLPQPCGIH